jgi:hypothetical protein
MGVKIRFHKGAWWLFIHHRKRRRAKKIGDRETALRAAQKVREALVAGDLRVTQKAPAETLNSYTQEWLRGLQSNLKASTVRFYRENLTRHVLPLLGDRPLTNITRADGRLLITTSREKGLRLNTVKGIARTLSTVLVATCRRNGFSDRCRMAVRRKLDAERRRRFLADLREILAAIEQEFERNSSLTGGER